MAERKFQPALLSGIVTLVLFTVLVSLGYWQVQRLAWKTQLLADINGRMAEKPVPMPEKIDKPEDWQFRRVTLAGQFDYAHEFLVKPRTLDGQAGYDMVVPFHRVSGGTVFVNRGWISDELMAKAERPQGPLLQIEGVLQAPKKDYFTPDNNPAKNDWYWADVPAMAQTLRIKDAAAVVVSISQKRPGVYPQGGRLHTDIPNDHKQYAIFWFAMAFVLLVIYALAHWQPVRKPENTYASL